MKQSILTNAKELLKVNKNTLKGLHNTFNFNFEEDSSVEIKEIKTPFTFSRLAKENDLTNKLAVVLISTPAISWRKDEWSMVILKNDGNFDIDTFKTSYSDGIDNFYRKSDANVARKNKEAKAFLIYANKKDVTEISKNSWSATYYLDIVKDKLSDEVRNDYRCLNRIKYDKKHIGTIVRNDKSVSIRMIDFCKINDSNIRFDLDVDYYNRPSNININDIIDKSGYNVLAKRDYLKQQARALQAKRKLNQAQSKDFSKENEKLRIEIFETKKSLIEKLKNASFDTEYKLIQGSEFKTIANKLELLNDLYVSYLQHLDRLQEMYNNNNTTNRYRKYCSISDVERGIEEMQNKLNNLNKIEIKIAIEDC